MSGRWSRWRLAAAAFAIINFAGGVYAVVVGEPSHAAGHVGLLLFITPLLWAAGSRGTAPDVRSEPVPEERLAYLQQSLDAIALEVERIGESQRFLEKLSAKEPTAVPDTRQS